MNELLKTLIPAVLLVSIPSGQSCTTFYLQRGENKVYGRTLDWYSEHGAVMINKMNVRKTAVLSDEGALPMTWTSRYSSLSFNQVARDFPYGGINEKGLIVETLILGATELPETPAGGSATNESQWIQYMLDVAENLDDVERYAHSLSIQKVFASLHYFVCDARSQCGVVEFIRGNVNVYRDASLRHAALANNTYPESLENLSRYQGFGGQLPIPDDDKRSLTRFLHAANFASNYTGNQYVDDAFYTLGKVADKTTRWQVVYDILGSVVNFKTPTAPAKKWIQFPGAFSPSCREPVMVYDLRTYAEGDVSTHLTPWTAAINEDLISRSKFLPDRLKALIRNYNPVCVE